MKVSQKCVSLKLDVVGLQEVGNPVEVALVCERFGYYSIMCGHEHGGVCLLIRQSLVPWIRQVLKSEEDCRLAGVVLDVKGVHVVFVTVYMPTGLDFVGQVENSVKDPTGIYNKLFKWLKLGS